MRMWVSTKFCSNFYTSQVILLQDFVFFVAFVCEVLTISSWNHMRQFCNYNFCWFLQTIDSVGEKPIRKLLRFEIGQKSVADAIFFVTSPEKSKCVAKVLQHVAEKAHKSAEEVETEV